MNANGTLKTIRGYSIINTLSLLFLSHIVDTLDEKNVPLLTDFRGFQLLFLTFSPCSFHRSTLYLPSFLFPPSPSFSHHPFMSFAPSSMLYYQTPSPLFCMPFPSLLPPPSYPSPCSSPCWLLPPVIVIVYCPYGRQSSHWPVQLSALH